MKEYPAYIVDIYDPDELNRYKIRVVGEHNADLPEDQLPWSVVSPGLGSGGGRGKSTNMLKGQKVGVTPTTAGKSEWIITSGSSTYEEEGKESEYLQNIDSDLIEEVPTPNISTGNIKKLAGTIFAALNTKLITAVIGAIGPSDPTSPPVGVKVTSSLIDLTSSPVTMQEGGNLGSLLSYITYEGHPAGTDEVEITLTDTGGMIGFDELGNTVEPEIVNSSLIIPAGINTDRDYTLTYNVVDLKEPGTPVVPSSNSIIVLVTDSTKGYSPIPRNILDTTIPGETRAAVTPQMNITEPKLRSDLASYPHNEVIQKENGLAMEIDGTPDKPRFAVNHPGGRLEINDLNEGIFKAEGGIYFISEDHLSQYIQGAVEMYARDYINMKTNTMFLEGELVVDGNVHITGELHVDGQGVSNVDFTGGGVSLKTHTHGGVKTGGGNTSVPN